jgi:hypothetical protein
MRVRSVLGLLLLLSYLLATSCSSYRDVYRTATFSPSQRDGSLVGAGLVFVKVEPDSTVVMMRDGDVIERAKPGHYLSSESEQSDTKVISASPERQTAQVSYLYSTNRPKL